MDLTQYDEGNNLRSCLAINGSRGHPQISCK